MLTDCLSFVVGKLLWRGGGEGKVTENGLNELCGGEVLDRQLTDVSTLKDKRGT